MSKKNRKVFVAEDTSTITTETLTELLEFGWEVERVDTIFSSTGSSSLIYILVKDEDLA